MVKFAGENCGKQFVISLSAQRLVPAIGLSSIASYPVGNFPKAQPSAPSLLTIAKAQYLPGAKLPFVISHGRFNRPRPSSGNATTAERFSALQFDWGSLSHQLQLQREISAPARYTGIPDRINEVLASRLFVLVWASLVAAWRPADDT